MIMKWVEPLVIGESPVPIDQWGVVKLLIPLCAEGSEARLL